MYSMAHSLELGSSVAVWPVTLLLIGTPERKVINQFLYGSFAVSSLFVHV